MKVLVTVHVPAIAEKFDVLIPKTMRIKSVVTLIAETVGTLSNQLYVSSGEECLCSAEKNILLRYNSTLERYGIQNGDHLILI